jgi:hypothetical protein
MKLVETRLNMEKGRLLILDSFLGLVHSEPLKGVRQFVDILPAMIKEAEESKKSPEYLRMHVLEVLTGGPLSCGGALNVTPRSMSINLPALRAMSAPGVTATPYFLSTKMKLKCSGSCSPTSCLLGNRWSHLK